MKAKNMIMLMGAGASVAGAAMMMTTKKQREEMKNAVLKAAEKMM